MIKNADSKRNIQLFNEGYRVNIHLLREYSDKYYSLLQFVMPNNTLISKQVKTEKLRSYLLHLYVKKGYMHTSFRDEAYHELTEAIEDLYDLGIWQTFEEDEDTDIEI